MLIAGAFALPHDYFKTTQRERLHLRAGLLVVTMSHRAEHMRASRFLSPTSKCVPGEFIIYLFARARRFARDDLIYVISITRRRNPVNKRATLDSDRTQRTSWREAAFAACNYAISNIPGGRESAIIRPRMDN